MLFHSFQFFIFFPIVTLVYYVVPKRARCPWLLAASYYFYMCWNAKYALLIAFSTAVTWASGLLVGKCQAHGVPSRTTKCIVAACFAANLGILGFFKYSGFIAQNLSFLLGKAGACQANSYFRPILPAGISFYTFQALSYTVDVYRREVAPERDIFKYALFVSFFPQLVAGPVERSGHLLAQIRRVGGASSARLLDAHRIAGGLMAMLWGYFLKLAIADRIAILVDTVFDSWHSYGTVELALAAAAFSIQIYCDFSSYSTIAAGAAQVLGFTLMENFNTPYFARSIQEFWRRWHISLSTWFKDYLYIPLGGSRCSTLRRHINTLATFLASGLWHGAGWHFVAWGAIHGAYQVVGAQTRTVRQKIHMRAGAAQESFSFAAGQAALTFLLTTFAWIFFRAGSMAQACSYIKRMFTCPDWWALTDGSIYGLGLNVQEFHILAVALLLLFLVDIVRYKKGETLGQFLASQCIWFRLLAAWALFAFIFLFGVYGPGYDASQFIYFQF